MTDLLFLSGAIASLLLAGCGAAFLVLPRHRPIALAELLGFAYLAGGAIVTLLSFAGWFLVSGLFLRVLVVIACAVVAAAGVALDRRLAGGSRLQVTRRDLVVAAVPVVPAAALAWLALRTPMAWDGVMTWEAKGRLAWMNGGGLPLSHLSQAYRFHPDYPLLVPLLEAWVYGWLGHVDQVLVKVLFAGFMLAAMWLLATSVTRLGLSVGWAAAAAILPVCVPRLVVGEGSATSGYADFPLAACYLACVVYLIEYLHENRPDALRAVGALAAILPWIKQEGPILWACAVFFAAVIAWRRRHFSALWWVALPGLMVVVGWRVVLFLADAPPSRVFLPVEPDTLVRNFHRLLLVAEALWRNAAGGDWSLLWPVAAFAAVAGAWTAREARPLVALLVAAVALPTAIYSTIFIFTAADPVWHISTSLSRLNIQVSLPAILLLVVPALGWPGTGQRTGASAAGDGAISNVAVRNA